MAVERIATFSQGKAIAHEPSLTNQGGLDLYDDTIADNSGVKELPLTAGSNQDLSATSATQAIKRPSMASFLRKLNGDEGSDKTIQAAFVRMKSLLALDRGQGPRPDVPARGYYLNITV